MEHEHKKGHKKGGRKKKHKHGNWSDDENKAADATETNNEPVFVPEETTDGGAIEIVDERRNSEVPADNEENSADCEVISDGAVEENAFEEENKAADATETNNEPVFVSEETTEEDAIEEENKAADATETNNEPVFVSEETTEEDAIEEENKAADATETNNEPVFVSEETTEGGAIEIVDERCNSEVPADYEENGADPVHFEDENEQNYFEVPVYNQENSVDGVVSLDGAVEENAFEEENKAADATETNTEPLPVPEETTEGGAIEIVDERCNSEVPADYEENGADPVHFEDENEQNYFEVPVYNQENSVDGVVSLDGAVEENAFEEENKAADATETNTEPVFVSEETTEGGAIEIVDERRNSEVPADYEENRADRDEAAAENAFQDGIEQNNSQGTSGGFSCGFFQDGDDEIAYTALCIDRRQTNDNGIVINNDTTKYILYNDQVSGAACIAGDLNRSLGKLGNFIRKYDIPSLEDIKEFGGDVFRQSHTDGKHFRNQFLFATAASNNVQLLEGTENPGESPVLQCEPAPCSCREDKYHMRTVPEVPSGDFKIGAIGGARPYVEGFLKWKLEDAKQDNSLSLKKLVEIHHKAIFVASKKWPYTSEQSDVIVFYNKPPSVTRRTEVVEQSVIDECDKRFGNSQTETGQSTSATSRKSGSCFPCLKGTNSGETDSTMSAEKDFKEKTFESLRQLPHAPSVQMHDSDPDAIEVDENAPIDEANPDERLPEAEVDKLIEDEGELYDGEKEGGDIRNESVPQKRPASAADTAAEIKKSKLEDESVTTTENKTEAVEE